MPKVDAIYKDGKFEPVEAVTLREGSRVRVEYEENGQQESGALASLGALLGSMTKEEGMEVDRLIEERFEHVEHDD